MELFATLLLCGMLIFFLAIDLFMLITLLRPGDERGQLIVWKASAYTLLSVTSYTLLTVIACLLRGEALAINPLVHLEMTATIYCIALLVIRRRHAA